METHLAGISQLPHPGREGLVDIVSGSFGAGHDAAAREIARRLEARGYAVQTWDIVDLMPGLLGRGLRAAYMRQIRSAPRSWGWLLRWLEKHDGAADRVARAVSSGAGPMLDRIDAARPDAIISTHPFASQALGSLRASGRLDVPAVTYLTDLSVHRLWVHEGVDLHLALHPLPADEAVGLGAGTTRVVRPVVPAWFAEVPDQAWARLLARRSLGLPAGPRLALVTGGSLGIGDLERAAVDLAATGLVVPVVLCGRNERLRRRLGRHPGMVALDWVEDMRTLYAAVDVVVQNAGGFTSLESRAMGVPTVTYRCIAGHGERNAAALDQAGWAPWFRSPDELASGLAAALAGPPVVRPVDEDPLDVVDAIFPVRVALATA